MAGYLNKMTIIGNLGADPEMRYLPSGEPVTNLRVAVTERRRQQDGNTQESTQWFNVSCFNKTAEVASQYLKKGASVYIEGPLNVREYTGNDGQKRFSLDIRAREMKMLDRAGAMASEDVEMEHAGARPAPDRSTAPDRNTHNSPAANSDDKMDDIPF